MAIPNGEHELKEMIEVDVFYPDHPPRKESNLFSQTKHQLIKVEDVPCWVCGTKDKREVHHFHAEWADSLAIDWDKMKELHPDFDWAGFVTPSDFIDSRYNMMVLCEKHHRAKGHGIHLIPYPVWIMQKIQQEGFVFSPDEEKKG
jgi:hypothetical protein